MRDVAVLIPVLRRPANVQRTIDYFAAATDVGSYRLLFIATEGDEAELQALEAAGADYVTMPPREIGDYACKINYGLQVTDEPFLFTGADDLKPHSGWLPAALAVARRPFIGVVGTQDLGSPRVLAGRHATHFLVAREYAVKKGTIDERGKIFHTGYMHEYVDDELVGTAIRRRAWAFAPKSVVEHLHPSWGKGEMDELYAQQEERMRYGREIFNRRRRLWT